MLYSIPLLIVVVVLYNVLAFIPSDASTINSVMFTMDLVSGAKWAFSVSDLIVLLGVLMLCIEIMKSARTSTSSIINHSLSVVLFVVCILEFILVKQAGTSTFFLITIYTLVDVVAGFTIGLVAARRDISMDRQVF